MIRTLFLAALIVLMPSAVMCGVSVDDAVVPAGDSVMLSARTTGRFFAKGGEMVAFRLDDKLLGRTLSGGDGMAYLEVKIQKPDLYRVGAESGGQKAEGLLLAVRKGSGIFFVDVAGALFDNILARRPREGSQEALKTVSGKIKVVYLNTAGFGSGYMKGWLVENGFPSAPLLDFNGGGVFERITGDGISVEAAVGAPAVAEAAASLGSKAFSFEEVEGAVTVSDWSEIVEAIK